MFICHSRSTRRRWIAALKGPVAGLCASLMFGCGNGSSSSSSNERFALTVYSSANPATFDPQELFQREETQFYPSSESTMPGFGVVRETRPMQLAAGENNLQFTDVAAGIDPTTVAIQSLTAPQSTSIVEQNFTYDLAAADQMLRKYIGKEVRLTVQSHNSDPQSTTGKSTREIRGTLLSAAGYYMIRPTDPPREILMLSSDEIVAWHLPDTSSDLVLKPTLNWKMNSAVAGNHEIQVTYQTDGLTWRADYNLVLAPGERSADLSAWVTLANASGISYPNAAVKLVAGNVHRMLSPDRARQVNTIYDDDQGNTNSGGGGVLDRRKLFDYHTYTIDHRTSLSNNATKQVELFPTRRQIPVEKVYIFDSLTYAQRQALFTSWPNPFDSDFGKLGNKSVDVFVRLINTEKNHLGIPLPAGRIRTYAADPTDDMREFVGEDIISHTPKDEEFLARVGTAFDLTGERTQTDFSRGSEQVTETFDIVLKNHQNVAVTMMAREILYRGLNWEIVGSSDQWVKQDYHAIRFPVTVPANGQKKISYTVRYTW